MFCSRLNSVVVATMDWEPESGSVEACLSCPLCQQSGCFSSADQLLRALKSLTGRPVTCGICGQCLADLPSYLEHLTSHLPPGSRHTVNQQQQVQQSPTSPPLPTDQLQTLTEHQAPASQQQTFLQCPHCPRMFKTARGRTSHMRAKHIKQNNMLSELAGTTTEKEKTGTLAPAQTDINGSLALFNYCLGFGVHKTAFPAAGSSSQTFSTSPRQSSSIHGAASDLVGGAQAPTAEQRPGSCKPALPTTTHPLDEAPVRADLRPPSPAVADTAALGRRGDGGRRLRRLLRASHACQDCGRVFRLRPGLAAHRRLAHGDGACEQCGVCQRRFTSVRRLQRHLASSHGLSTTVSLISSTWPGCVLLLLPLLHPGVGTTVRRRHR